MKKALFIILILVTAMFAAAVYAADKYGYTKYGTYYEYPSTTTYSSQARYSPYYPTTYYPERYYYQPRSYDYTRNLYRYSGYQQAVVERPSYIGFLEQINSNAKEGQLCGVLMNKFYNCADGLTCKIMEKQIGICRRDSAV
jgi:hypothetical protein